MTRTLKTEDFKFRLFEEARRLRQEVQRSGHYHMLDPKTAMFVVTEEAWSQFHKSQDFMPFMMETRPHAPRNSLMGIPVRITFDDEEGTPPIQLVMQTAPTRLKAV